MLLFVICIIALIISIGIFDEDGLDNKKLFLILVSSMFTVWTFFIFYSNDFKGSYKKQVEITKTNIYSFYKDSESFVLGTNVIDNKPQYSYFITNNDGSKEKKFLESNGTKIIDYDDGQPYFENVKCITGEHYNVLFGFFIETDEEKCENKIERKLFIPKNSVILENNFQLQTKGK